MCKILPTEKHDNILVVKNRIFHLQIQDDGHVSYM